MAMKVGVVVFPGSNCDHDTLYAFGEVMGLKAYEIWHAESKDLSCLKSIWGRSSVKLNAAQAVMPGYMV